MKIYEISTNEQNGASDAWALNGAEITPDEAMKIIDEHETGYQFDNKNDIYILLNKNGTPYLQLKAITKN